MAYLKSLKAHIANVQKAAFLIGGIPYDQVVTHDLSKFEVEEFPYYVRQYKGDKGDPKGYQRAWLHHIHHIPHHWQYWIVPPDHQVRNSEDEGSQLLGDLISIQEIKGPWISIGVHIDFQRPHIHIHFLWWIVTIGHDYHVNTQKDGVKDG